MSTIGDTIKTCFLPTLTTNAFCLMPNHFHLLLHQAEDETAVSKAMQSLGTTYSMYFNRKHQRRGSIFESVFKASPILSDVYLQHITRYIHLNPKGYPTWEHSSYQDFIGTNSNHWVAKHEILELFDSVEQYQEFVDDYTALHEEFETLKHELADHGITYYKT